LIFFDNLLFRCFLIRKNAKIRAPIPKTPRATPIPMPAFAPELRPPELAVFDAVGPVEVADPEVGDVEVPELVDELADELVDDGANT
jgi:hypothetical protein